MWFVVFEMHIILILPLLPLSFEVSISSTLVANLIQNLAVWTLLFLFYKRYFDGCQRQNSGNQDEVCFACPNCVFVSNRQMIFLDKWKPQSIYLPILHNNCLIGFPSYIFLYIIQQNVFKRLYGNIFTNYFLKERAFA